MLLAPVLTLLLGHAAPAQPAQDPGFGPSVELRLLEGDGLALEGREILDLRAGGPARRVHATALLELGTGSSARLRWDAMGSLELHGGAALTVAPARADGPDLGPARARLSHLHAAELELRRGELVVELPGDWVLEMGRAAVQLRQRVTGAVELLHRGGEPLRVRRRPKSGDSGPTEHWLRAGTRIRLQPR